jgi:hypothetical protein
MGEYSASSPNRSSTGVETTDGQFAFGEAGCGAD